jgi:hypothetical protein
MTEISQSANLDGPRLEPRKKVGFRKVARSQILRFLENTQREGKQAKRNAKPSEPALKPNSFFGVLRVRVRSINST